MREMTIKCDDPAIAGALVEGASAAQLRLVQAECARLQAINGVRSEGDSRRWERQKRRLARKYHSAPDGRVKGAILGAYGLIVWMIHEAWEYLDEWNRTGVRPNGNGHVEVR